MANTAHGITTKVPIFHRTRHLHQCKACTDQIFLTAGTIFHKVKVTLAEVVLDDLSDGAPEERHLHALALEDGGEQRLLDTLDHQHKIRKAMADRDAYCKLAGLIEMDDASFGASKLGRRGCAAFEEAKVMVAV